MRLLAAAAALMLFPVPRVHSQSTSDVRQRGEEQECISLLSGFPSKPPTTTPVSYPTELDDVTIEYFESGCLGSCPAFTLRIGKDVADWDGHAYVRARGKRKARVTPQQFDNFLGAWFDGKFSAMRDDYCDIHCPNGTIIVVTDLAESSITLKTPEFTKRVYQCFATIDAKPITPKPPEEYFALVKQLRAFAKSKKWLR